MDVAAFSLPPRAWSPSKPARISSRTTCRTPPPPATSRTARPAQLRRSAAGEHARRSAGRRERPGRGPRQDLHRSHSRGDHRNRRTARLRDPGPWLLRRPDRPGVRYTRDGQFTASASGTLTDANGNPVLGPSGAQVKVPASGPLSPSAVGLYELTGAEKQGQNLYTGTAAGKPPGASVRARSRAPASTRRP